MKDLYPIVRDWLGKSDLDIHVSQGLYLRRWYLKDKTSTGNAYLHQILLDDDKYLHDHPWDNVSIILSGILREIRPGNQTEILPPGSIVERKAEDSHRLEVVKGPVWSLFLTGPWQRTWGFWVNGEWVPHYEHLR